MTAYRAFEAYLKAKEDLSDKFKNELIRMFELGQEEAFERGQSSMVEE